VAFPITTKQARTSNGESKHWEFPASRGNELRYKVAEDASQGYKRRKERRLNPERPFKTAIQILKKKEDESAGTEKTCDLKIEKKKTIGII